MKLLPKPPQAEGSAVRGENLLVDTLVQVVYFLVCVAATVGYMWRAL